MTTATPATIFLPQEEQGTDIPTSEDREGRVCFNLAEIKGNETHPFAFLATYTKSLIADGKIQHALLSKIFQNQSEDNNRQFLLSLLIPLQKAARESSFLKDLMESNKIFHPQAWTPKEAYQFLKDIPIFEKFGLMVRLPDWKSKKPLRPMVSVKMGDKTPSQVGLDSLLSFDVNVSLDGEELTEEEWHKLTQSTEGLVLIRGTWVEVDADKLQEVLGHWQEVKQEMQNGISFSNAMRILYGMHPNFISTKANANQTNMREWTKLNPGTWLFETLDSLRSPSGLAKLDIQDTLQGTLRPYQENGLKWLWFLYSLKLGACLADDMGLGKTIQVLSLLLVLKKSRAKNRPSLLIAPASLLSNWLAEAGRFAPSLRITLVHPSEKNSTNASSFSDQNLKNHDLILTSYGFLNRVDWFKNIDWDIIILDEAQAIKNPGAKQTQLVKELRANHRIALTGTPIENRLGDLWSLFDFLNPGLLGNVKAFTQYVKSQGEEEGVAHGSLRSLVKPYILRRMKTDKDIAPDLPEKIEIKVRCHLSKMQAILYSESVETLRRQLETADGIQRRGIVLSFLMRFKQICNHPSHWLSDGNFDPEQSGKFLRLQELAEEISNRQEKVLVFTQFKEITPVLERTLSSVFKRKGLILHGQTPVKQRKELVAEFQREDGPPFFVLSLKAGGTGLNLTAASHVIHFDRWWNPAVENQASDRAFRIGQKRNVLIHKFMCVGTVEERIDKMISDKQALAGSILETGMETSLTELSNDELISMVSLDLSSVVQE